jgi:hypothetical protein
MSEQDDSFVPLMDSRSSSELSLVGAVQFDEAGVRWSDSAVPLGPEGLAMPGFATEAVDDEHFKRFSFHVAQGV